MLVFTGKDFKSLTYSDGKFALDCPLSVIFDLVSRIFFVAHDSLDKFIFSLICRAEVEGGRKVFICAVMKGFRKVCRRIAGLRGARKLPGCEGSSLILVRQIAVLPRLCCAFSS